MIAGALMLLASCQKPQFVEPTADRQGITSLSAIFTFGPFMDSEIVRYQIEDPNAERFVIPIPYYYPEASFDSTEPYMTKIRVQAELQPNCTIEPSLGDHLLDLTQENWFTYTNAQGESRPICITGERVKSNKCELISFALTDPALTGVIDKAARTVTLITVEDLAACTAVAQISAHATISPDPAEVRSYDEPVTFTVTAHNGVDKTEYVVAKGLPEKIEKGFNMNTVEQLFNFDPVSMLGMPAYTESVAPSLAYVDGKLVVAANGMTPIYLNAKTGVKEGTVTLGSAEAYSVTNDEGNYILYCNHANGGETFNIWRSTSVDVAPELYHSFTNTTSFPMGAKMKVNGSLDGDALIVITNEGVAGVTESGMITVVEVKGGAIVNTTVVDLSAVSTWGEAPVNIGTVVAASADMADGWFTSQYEPSEFRWIKSDVTLGVAIPSDMTGWGLNPNCLDAKTFNNVEYVTLFVVSHFPAWGMGPELYLYDVTDKAQVTGGDVTLVPGTVLSNRAITWYQTGSYAIASGDVVIAPTADGFTFQLYYYDHNSQVIGGYAADCIKR